MAISILDGLGFRNARQLPWKKSPNVGGRLVPEYIVLHDTASGLNADGPINWLTMPASKVSAHVVIARDGTITQLVPFNVKAWHAGQSVWKGRQLLNGFSIGIEIVNPGKMTRVSDGVYKGVQQYDTRANPSLVIERKRTNPHGDGYWMAYTPQQIEAVKELCAALCQEYQIKEILTHWLISPGRKVDTNPLFPLEEVRSHVASLTTRSIRPVAVAEFETDESEGAGDEPAVKNDDYDAPRARADVDESEGGTGLFARLYKSRTVQGVIGAITSAFSAGAAFLTDWRVVGILCLTGVVCFALFIVYRRSLQP